MAKDDTTTVHKGRRDIVLGLGAMASFAATAPASAAGASAPAQPSGPSAAALAASPENGTVWWVELVSQDLKRASEFYSSVIGWSSKTVALADGSRAPAPNEPELLLFMTGGNEVAGALLTSKDAPGKGDPRWIVYFQVPDVDAAVKLAQTKGGKLLIHPFDVGSTVRLAVVEDPDGVPFGLATPV